MTEPATSGAMFNFSPLLVTIDDGLERLLEILDPEDFMFDVNGEKVKSTLAEAVLISPNIHEGLRTCPETRTFTVAHKSVTADDFRRYLDFVRSRALKDFLSDDQSSFLTISGLLGNRRLTYLLLESLPPVDERQEVSQIDAEVCSGKFSDYSVETIQRIEKRMLHEILSSPSLRLENEDSFLETLISLGSDYFEYWDYLEVQNLTSDGISRFIDTLPFDSLTEMIWEGVKKRLRGSKSNDSNCARYEISSTTVSPSQNQRSAATPPQHSEPSPTPPDANPSKMSPPPSPPAQKPLDSRIVSDLPEIFAEFRSKHFEMLWRGSRDGFGAQEFHGRCDGHGNTLTVILDTEGNILGGFTPLKWESSSSGKWKADGSLKSFLFTLKNPHNIPARRFALKAEMKHQAIYCHSGWGPTFGGIAASGYCNANTSSRTFLGDTYTNDTGLNGIFVFTGSQTFQVQEIEVFEITE